MSAKRYPLTTTLNKTITDLLMILFKRTVFLTLSESIANLILCTPCSPCPPPPRHTQRCAFHDLNTTSKSGR